MATRNTFPTSHYSVCKGDYRGILTTYSKTRKGITNDLESIKTIIEDVVQQAGVPVRSFKLHNNREIEVRYFWATGTFPNLFLPANERTEASNTSFDGIISYLIYKLAKSGYRYNGEILASSGSAEWKLNVRDEVVLRIEGKVTVVYEEDNAYQVGGVEL